MAAAVTLAGRGVPVTVYEAARELGGRARMVMHRETALDNGQHILIGAYRETLRLIRLVHPDAAGALQRMPLAWRVHGRFSLAASWPPAPLHLLAGLLRAQGVTRTERWSAVRFMATLRWRGFRLDRDTTVARLLAAHRQGDGMIRYLWNPLCVSALNTPPEKASAQVFLNVLRDSLASGRDASELLLARTDLTALFPAPAAEYVRARGGTVRTATRVTAIDPQHDGFSIVTPGGVASASHVICALPPHQVRAFLVGITALADAAETVGRLDYQPIVTIYFQFEDAVRLPAPMLGLDDATAQWLFDREAIAGQRGLVAAVISAEGPHLELAQEDLAARVHAELVARCGPLPPLAWHRVITEKRATFSCTPHLRRPPSETPLRHLYLAGDYTAGDYPATLEAAVRSGIHCAEMIIKTSS